MPLLNASLRSEVQRLFADLPRPVSLLVFTRPECQACDDARALAEELASIAPDKILLDVLNMDTNPPESALMGIDKTPALVVLGGDSARQDYGMRFYGSAAGYEFATLIEDIRMASAGTADLSPAMTEALGRLTGPLHLQVFVTPTCPYCPRAVLLAHRMAMASDRVTADAVDASEFPDLADQYHVRGVPRTVANDTVHIEGAVPEATLLAELLPILSLQDAHVEGMARP
jgi:glutaredoxin-like protein